MLERKQLGTDTHSNPHSSHSGEKRIPTDSLEFKFTFLNFFAKSLQEEKKQHSANHSSSPFNQEKIGSDEERSEDSRNGKRFEF